MSPDHSAKWILAFIVPNARQTEMEEHSCVTNQAPLQVDASPALFFPSPGPLERQWAVLFSNLIRMKCFPVDLFVVDASIKSINNSSECCA